MCHGSGSARTGSGFPHLQFSPSFAKEVDKAAAYARFVSGPVSRAASTHDGRQLI